MIRNVLKIVFLAICVYASGQPATNYYVDSSGILRDAQHKEASFYGVNYTLPFAHAYRAAAHFSVDYQKAIQQDVYHFARLGFNAYRIHIWDVEISDDNGNLLENQHLDLLDFLLAELKKRGIKSVITAQTNFGNGYPERNQATQGYSNHFDKCEVHQHEEAIQAQEKYISALVQHINPYTGMAYLNDPDIVGFEINNEPCHAGTEQETQSYIERMLHALNTAGNQKPVFYNVSHNQQVVKAYYQTAVHGTTYQWYPIGLVAGKTRQGNFLPYVDSYPIPFSSHPNFHQKAKLVYEFDPADILYSYMYPAMVRTFRTAGFQWITQFAYDPMCMAQVNSEYPTHYLNLAYTPSKAMSMRIAAEAAYTLPLFKKYGTYPADTVFQQFRVSSKNNLSELNTSTTFLYSNTTQTRPIHAKKLETVAGVGSSPVVAYPGTGAYFMDRLEKGIWRLEVMPDAVLVDDPFKKPAWNKEVVRIYHRAHRISIQLPDLGDNFKAIAINQGNSYSSVAQGSRLDSILPGVYLLVKEGQKHANWKPETSWKNLTLNEYAAPASFRGMPKVHHTPASKIPANMDLPVKATIAWHGEPDSVVVYPSDVTIYTRGKTGYPMQPTGAYTYETKIPARAIHGETARYTISVYTPTQSYTYPGDVLGAPLEWDFTNNQRYTTAIVPDNGPLFLVDVQDYPNLETYMLPAWGRVQHQTVRSSPASLTLWEVSFTSAESKPDFFIRKYLANDLVHLFKKVKGSTYLCIQLPHSSTPVQAGFVCSNGFTYTAELNSDSSGIARVPLAALEQTTTALLPVAYPVFMPRYFTPKVQLPFEVQEIETLEIRIKGTQNKPCTVTLGAVWIE